MNLGFNPLAAEPLRVASRVRRVLEAEGISEPELDSMLARSAITSMRGFNRRFHHWLFKVCGREVEAMVSSSVVVVGRGKEQMSEDCARCQGSGCSGCGWHGVIVRRIG